MPGPFKVSFLFNGPAGQGFSETWYYEKNQALNDADKAIFKTFAFRRTNICAVGWSCPAIRAHDLDSPRLTHLIESGTVPKAQDNDEGPDIAGAAWLFRAQAQTGQKRQVWFRGSDDSYIKWDAVQKKFLIQPNMMKRVDQFESVLIGPVGAPTLWRIRTVRPVNDPATNTTTVTSVQTSPLGHPILTCTAVIGFAGQTIIVSGFKRPFGYLNGVYSPREYTLAGNTVILSVPVTADVIGAPLSSVRVRLQSLSYLPITSLDFVQPGTRKVGRAFFVPAGRRPNRR